MPLPVALNPPLASVLLLYDARYRTYVLHTGTILLFRFFEKAYRHLRFSRMAEHEVSRMDNVVDVVLLYSILSILLSFRMSQVYGYMKLHNFT